VTKGGRRLLLVAVAVALVVALSVGGFFTYRHLHPEEHTKQVGEVCVVSDECAAIPCIHEFTGEGYCAKLCDNDDDCPSAFVCDPTRSLLRHACMKAGVQTGVASGGSPVYRRVREP
jgi:hypothetical protein